MNRVNIIPMAGEGKRFKDVGYIEPKPLLKVNNTPMFILAARSLPKADNYIFICNKNHELNYKVSEYIKDNFQKFELIMVDNLTDGQARTCMLANDLLSQDDIISIGPCDSYFEYDKVNYQKILEKTDAVVWSFKSKLTLENPKMFGWIKINKAKKVSEIKCKQPISQNPENDNAVVGAFTFKNKNVFIQSIESMIKKNRRINNEFYLDVAIDEAIKLGYDVGIVQTKKFKSFGTPSEYEKNKFF